MSILAVFLSVFSASVFAQDTKPDLAELWETGSLWEVGDNRQLVKDARQALIDAGDEGLKFALTKLSASDTLQIRCLNDVIKGFGDKAHDSLIDNINHEDATARRNVAELLSQLDITRAAEPLLAQARSEESMGARLAQLAALAGWGSEDAIPLIVEISNSEVDRIRHRVTGLLGTYEQGDAVLRLIEMLDDKVFYVRDGARNALVGGSIGARSVCLMRLKGQFALPSDQQMLQRIRLLLPVVATLANDEVPTLLTQALKHESGLVRGDAAGALVTWKNGAGLLDTKLDVKQLLAAAIDNEHDPFAKSAIETARAKLKEADTK